MPTNGVRESHTRFFFYKEEEEEEEEKKETRGWEKETNKKRDESFSCAERSNGLEEERPNNNNGKNKRWGLLPLFFVFVFFSCTRISFIFCLVRQPPRGQSRRCPAAARHMKMMGEPEILPFNLLWNGPYTQANTRKKRVARRQFKGYQIHLTAATLSLLFFGHMFFYLRFDFSKIIILSVSNQAAQTC